MTSVWRRTEGWRGGGGGRCSSWTGTVLFGSRLLFFGERKTRGGRGAAQRAEGRAAPAENISSHRRPGRPGRRLISFISSALPLRRAEAQLSKPHRERSLTTAFEFLPSNKKNVFFQSFLGSSVFLNAKSIVRVLDPVGRLPEPQEAAS